MARHHLLLALLVAPAGALQGGVYRSGVVGAKREARRESPFKWVLCMSEVMARDEDLFSTLKELGEADERNCTSATAATA